MATIKSQISNFIPFIKDAWSYPTSKTTNHEPSWYYGGIFVLIALTSTAMPLFFGWGHYALSFLLTVPDLLFGNVIMGWIFYRFVLKVHYKLDEYAIRVSRGGLRIAFWLLVTPAFIWLMEQIHWTSFTFLGIAITAIIGKLLWFILIFLLLNAYLFANTVYHIVDIVETHQVSPAKMMLLPLFIVLYDLLDIIILVVLNP